MQGKRKEARRRYLTRQQRNAEYARMTRKQKIRALIEDQEKDHRWRVPFLK